MRFVIGRDDKVSNVADGISDLPDPVAVHCMLSVFSSLDFPLPVNGIVTVLYPVKFSPE
ncbi:MAG: hypothetical protein SFV15_04710 [Polyangiaceae bacterium]|nr:hypothetical protein [Polyangiaceae bacterium]